MLFYMYDLEAYRDDIRGFYIDLSELPGEIVGTERELIDSIKNINLSTKRQKNQYINSAFNDTNTCWKWKRIQRLLDTLFQKLRLPIQAF